MEAEASTDLTMFKPVAHAVSPVRACESCTYFSEFFTHLPRCGRCHFHRQCHRLVICLPELDRRGVALFGIEHDDAIIGIKAVWLSVLRPPVVFLCFDCISHILMVAPDKVQEHRITADFDSSFQHFVRLFKISFLAQCLSVVKKTLGVPFHLPYQRITFLFKTLRHPGAYRQQSLVDSDQCTPKCS